VCVDAERGRYRVFATYRNGGMVAVSFDPGGDGMVNFPTGHCAFTYTASTGVGKVYDTHGVLTRTVGTAGEGVDEESVQLLLDAHLVRRHFTSLFTPHHVDFGPRLDSSQPARELGSRT
jgi:hypothetical protein